ncbi:phenylalanine--tRNA ligase subunit beta [Haloarchaeobius sp. HRN-SO-5]|uniref:phenylalanine--tRNA ligase subunit beta n=1 Tax=Haloarchaeobius sp. HRN-SO-5 TaxID=3446118 RepID=UPI003EBC4A0D
MPVVDVDPDELRTLTGYDEKSDDELRDDLFALGLEYEGETDDGEFQLEFAPDRLDRLSVEGVARSLRYQYGDDRGVYVPKTNDPDWTIHVDESVPDERPYVTGAVVRGVDLDEDALDSLIQLQEKLHATMGRKRAKGAIGIHDLTMLKGRAARSGEEPGDGAGDEGGNSIEYVGIAPDGDRFVPLDSDREMTPAEVLADHQIGETYADLVADYERYPAIYDDIGLFSFPPVINGRRTEVSTDSRDLLVEMTGTDQWTIDKMLNIVCYALDARGATIEEVTVEYPDESIYAGESVDLVAPGADLVRPNFALAEKTVSHARIETLLGISLDPEEVLDLLERSGMDATTAERETTATGDDVELVYEVDVPPYRVDVLHPLDVVDDVGRAYGFNELTPTYPEVGTVGGRHERSTLEDAVRDQLVGLGFTDLLNFHMTNETENYGRMRLDPDEHDCVGAGQPVTITEPYSEDYTMVRSWALPSVTMVLENNTHRAYPQDVAEVGFAAEYDADEDTYVAERQTVAAALARHDASYEDAKGRLQALARDFGVDLETPPTDHPSFIDGRTAAVVMDGETVGVVGELHPAVLVEHDLELPVVAFEFDLGGLR